MLPMPTLLGQTPLPMRSWFPPFAKCAKDEADLVIGGDSRSKAGAPAIPPPIKIKIPALCLRRTQTQGRGTLHLKLMQAEKARPTQVVVEPDKAAETPLGMTPWSASGQGHDCDEAAGGEAEDATVPPASAEEVYSAMSVEDRIAMRKDFDRKGLIRPDELEAYFSDDVPDPLLLAITRGWLPGIPQHPGSLGCRLGLEAVIERVERRLHLHDAHTQATGIHGGLGGCAGSDRVAGGCGSKR
jgi:hypothetical protein